MGEGGWIFESLLRQGLTGGPGRTEAFSHEGQGRPRWAALSRSSEFRWQDLGSFFHVSVP